MSEIFSRRLLRRLCSLFHHLHSSPFFWEIKSNIIIKCFKTMKKEAELIRVNRFWWNVYISLITDGVNNFLINDDFLNIFYYQHRHKHYHHHTIIPSFDNEDMRIWLYSLSYFSIQNNDDIPGRCLLKYHSTKFWPLFCS